MFLVFSFFSIVFAYYFFFSASIPFLSFDIFFTCSVCLVFECFIILFYFLFIGCFFFLSLLFIIYPPVYLPASVYPLTYQSILTYPYITTFLPFFVTIYFHLLHFFLSLSFNLFYSYFLLPFLSPSLLSFLSFLLPSLLFISPSHPNFLSRNTFSILPFPSPSSLFPSSYVYFSLFGPEVSGNEALDHEGKRGEGGERKRREGGGTTRRKVVGDGLDSRVEGIVCVWEEGRGERG